MDTDNLVEISEATEQYELVTSEEIEDYFKRKGE